MFLRAPVVSMRITYAIAVQRGFPKEKVQRPDD